MLIYLIFQTRTKFGSVSITITTFIPLKTKTINEIHTKIQIIDYLTMSNFTLVGTILCAPVIIKNYKHTYSRNHNLNLL